MSSFGQQSNIAFPTTFYTLKMNDHGLQNSIWAHNGDLDHSKRAGNWICPSCGFSNFVWRKLCFRCSSDPHFDGLPTNGHRPVSADSLEHIPISSHANHQAQPSNGISFQTNYLTVTQKEPGLATSRWAPRNHHGRSTHQIWTRVCLHRPCYCPLLSLTFADHYRSFPTLPEQRYLPLQPLLISAFPTKFSITYSP